FLARTLAPCRRRRFEDLGIERYNKKLAACRSSIMTDKLNDSFMRSLCMGEIREDIIFPYPKMQKEEAETLKSLFESLESWLKGRDKEFREWDVAGEMPSASLQEMREFGLFSL